eukprot:COSAG02_NODE_522_length_20749_cov_14.985278_4_plen_69_part_00
MVAFYRLGLVVYRQWAIDYWKASPKTEGKMVQVQRARLFGSVGGTYAPSQDPLSSSAAAPYPRSVRLF